MSTPVEGGLPKNTANTFFEKYIPDGWELWDNGLSSQQNKA